MLYKSFNIIGSEYDKAIYIGSVFLIAISIYGFCFVAAVMWFSTAKRETSDDSEEHF